METSPPESEPEPRAALERREAQELAREGELPLVARMVVEVRSDGTRYVAEGGLEDLLTGTRVAIRTDELSPLELSRSLSKALLATTPDLAKATVKAMIPRRLRRLGRLLARRDDP